MPFVIKRGSHYAKVYRQPPKQGVLPNIIGAPVWRQNIPDATHFKTRREAENIAGQLQCAPGETIEVIEV